jgi:hypothetical protein
MPITITTLLEVTIQGDLIMPNFFWPFMSKMPTPQIKKPEVVPHATKKANRDARLTYSDQKLARETEKTALQLEQQIEMHDFSRKLPQPPPVSKTSTIASFFKRLLQCCFPWCYSKPKAEPLSSPIIKTRTHKAPITKVPYSTKTRAITIPASERYFSPTTKSDIPLKGRTLDEIATDNVGIAQSNLKKMHRMEKNAGHVEDEARNFMQLAQEMKNRMRNS